MKTEDLILENQALINFVISQMRLKCNREEYFSAGQIGLIKAANTYDESKGIKFSTYAGRCIEHEIFREIYYKNRDKRKNSYTNISLDLSIEGNYKDMLFYEIIDSGVNLEEDFIKQERIKLLYKIIAILEPNDRFMLEHYFGLLKKEKMTQKKIAEVLGVKDRYVNYRIKRAMRIIKKIMEDKYEKEN